VRFWAHGKATGPVPGTFTAHGRWLVLDSAYSGKQTLDFHESFAIVSSDAGTVEGTMLWGPSIGPEGCESYTYQRVSYIFDRETGTANVNLSGRDKRFYEALQ
jgi:hypothetical protein